MRDGTCAVRDSQRMFGPRCDVYIGEGNEDIARWSSSFKGSLACSSGSGGVDVRRGSRSCDRLTGMRCLAVLPHFDLFYSLFY